MSASLNGIAIGDMTGSLRSPERNAFICFVRYAACWPASFGHSGLMLLPSGP